MATITVKNVPVDLYAELKAVAAANRRSVNSEVIVCLERVVRNQRVDAETLLASARLLRVKTEDYPVSDEEFSRLKRTGRL